MTRVGPDKAADLPALILTEAVERITVTHRQFDGPPAAVVPKHVFPAEGQVRREEGFPANRVKICHDRVVKRSWNRCITKVPHNEARQISTAMSSHRTAGEGNTSLPGRDAAVAPSLIGCTITLRALHNGETNA